MQGKRILLVSSAFYPEISPRSFRAIELAKEFYRQGHNVTVISKFRNFDYSEFLKDYPVNFKMWNKPHFPEVPEFKSMPLSILSRGLKRLLVLLFEYPGIEELFQVKRMLKHESGYDLMISFAVPYPVHWGVACARSKRNTIARTWVADCGDPYMFQRLDRFRKPRYFKYLEASFCRKCDYITIPIEGMQNKFYPDFFFKIRVIPQGVNFKDIKLHNENKFNGKPVFLFAGSIIPGKRDLKLFLDFLVTLKTDFLFIIYTNQKKWFCTYKIILGEKLELREYIDRISLIFEMSKANFLVNVDTIYESHSNVEAVPSKLIDYALAERPILNIISNSLDKEMVLEFLKGDYSKQRIINKPKYDIRKVADRFLYLINN